MPGTHYTPLRTFAADQLVRYGDSVLVQRSTTLGANTAYANVLVGTPVVQANPADTLILSNTVANGDIVLAVNNGGNSLEAIRVDASAQVLDLGHGLIDGGVRIKGQSIVRTATYVVAANGAPAHVKAQADYICDGTADDVQIQAALSALTAGRTWIETVKLIGSFTTAALVTIPSYTRLDLSEAVVTTVNNTFVAFRNSDTVGGNSFIEVIGGRVTGGYYNVAFNNVDDGRIEGVETDTAQFNGIDVRNGARVVVAGNYSHNNGSNGINFVAMTDSAFLFNRLLSNTGRGLLGESGVCSNVVIQENIIRLNTNTGLSVEGTGAKTDIVIASNLVADNGQNGIAVAANVTGAVVSGNVSRSNGSATSHQGIIVNGEDVVVIGNRVVENAGQGIDIGYASRCIVMGNHVEANGAAGINIEGSATGDADDCVVSGNTVRGNGLTTAEGGIYLHTIGGAGSVDNCVLTGNRVTTDAGIGIRIGDARCNNNKVAENDVTGNTGDGMADAGTGTKLGRSAGWVTENSGTATVLNTTTSIAVTHGLAATPTRVQITPRENPTNAVAFWWVDTLGATQFTIHVNADPGASGLDFDWRAVVGEGN